MSKDGDDDVTVELDTSLFTHTAADAAPISTVATAMLFGTITFAACGLAARTWLTGDVRAIRAAFDPRAKPLDIQSYVSVYTLLHHLTVFGLILLFAYICEYHPPYPHSDKSYDRDEFFFLTALLFVVSAYTIHRNDGTKDGKQTDAIKSETKNGNGGFSQRRSSSSSKKVVADVNPANDVLNRDQTEEWKGWMQFMFLLYHYFHAEETYNSIRIMITCYVWMTGFGNFSFFYLKGDYSSVRVMQMLWRLNFLVVFLCLSQGTTYILYYICPLHTYFFLMVYFTMRIGKHLNYTKYGLRFKLAILALVIYLLWDVDSGIFQLIHFPFLSTTPKLGAGSGSMWEWYFRSSLDHWSTFLGMIFALNYPITSLFYRKLETQSFTTQLLGKGAVAVGLLAAFYVWVSGPFMQAKLEYNATNAYFGFIPLITYIYLRNLTPTLRSYSLDLLHQIGKTTLETYLMQHHIWLTSNAKSLLTLVPGWPKCNFLLVTLIYFYTARRLYKLTLFLRGMLLPDDKAKCIRSLVAIAASVGVFYVVALTLDSMGMVSLMAIAIVSIICGGLLYQTIMDGTWQAFCESAPTKSSIASPDDSNSIIESMITSRGMPNTDSESTVGRFSPPLIGTVVIFIIGIIWHGMALNGAGKIKPLHEGCDAMVNNGRWVPVNSCNEESRGAGYRNYGVTNYATCSSSGASGTYVWGWYDTEPYTQCRFVKRDAKSLKKALNHRTIYFVGDSMTRNLYHSTLRAMGMDSGAYDATQPKHADITNSIGSTTVEFRWAPLAKDQVSALNDINSGVGVAIGGGAGQFLGPDLIVLGGGTWDRLHVYATDEDKKSLAATVKDLAKQMRTARNSGSPVAWLIPTTINSKALNTEEKRDHMREEDVEEMRALHAESGILSSSSFVIDGPGFTSDRVSESYDGVHYPPHVYDAGAQILANAMDWLLPERDIDLDLAAPPAPGEMANPFLGLMMLCFVFIGLMFFDGFLGFSFLASLFVKDVMPNDLYEEAFTALHRKMKLPEIEPERGISSSSSVFSSAMSIVSSGETTWTMRSQKSSGSGGGPRQRSKSPGGHKSNASTVDEEIAALLGGNSSDIEIAMRK